LPTYDYVCDACSHTCDVFQSIKDPVLTICPACGEEKLRRKIGAGAGIIFKGSGFYETDYKRSRASSKNGGSKDKPSESKSDSSSTSKSSDSSSSSKKSGD
jgi:putative FmdB family regulatory protein